jgi:hypothetical protein
LMGTIAIQEPRVTVPPIQIIKRQQPVFIKGELVEIGKMVPVDKVNQRPKRP